MKKREEMGLDATRIGKKVKELDKEEHEFSSCKSNSDESNDKANIGNGS